MAESITEFAPMPTSYTACKFVWKKKNEIKLQNLFLFEDGSQKYSNWLNSSQIN